MKVRLLDGHYFASMSVSFLTSLFHTYHRLSEFA